MIGCNPANYTPGRPGRVAYIVIHYTAGNGDTAENNCKYFANNKVGASAHYFVDEYGWMQSVKDTDTAWHCGAQRYVHATCRNANSIGVELCSRKRADGQYCFLPETVRNAQTRVRSLLRTYGLDTTRVLRHYDVTGKQCPAPFVLDGTAWKAFVDGLKENCPSTWAAEAAAWAVSQGYFKGDGAGNFRWREPVSRQELAVLLHRMAQN